MDRHKIKLVIGLACIAIFSSASCSNNEPGESSQPSNPPSSVNTYTPPQTTSATSLVHPTADKAKVQKRGQTDQDKLQDAINLFRAGEYIDDQDSNYYADVRVDPNNPSRGIEITLTPSFFQLPHVERLRVIRLYYKQWLSSIKEAGIKVNPKYKANYLDATIGLVDSVDHKNAGGMTDDPANPVWVVDD